MLGVIVSILMVRMSVNIVKMAANSYYVGMIRKVREVSYERKESC